MQTEELSWKELVVESEKRRDYETLPEETQADDEAGEPEAEEENVGEENAEESEGEEAQQPPTRGRG